MLVGSVFEYVVEVVKQGGFIGGVGIMWEDVDVEYVEVKVISVDVCQDVLV